MARPVYAVSVSWQAPSDLIIRSLRGASVGTRLGKLDSGDYDAIILAVAGLEASGGWSRAFAWRLPPKLSLPAVGGAPSASEVPSGRCAYPQNCSHR